MPPPMVQQQYTRDQLVAYARQVAIEYGIDPDIFVAQINQESGFDPNARNPSGATGIAQLMPQYYPNIDPTNPIQSLRAAASTDAGNLHAFNGRYDLMLAAYDAGAGAVQNAGGNVPDIPETQTYVRDIMNAALASHAGGGVRYMAQDQPVNPPTSGDVSLNSGGAEVSGDTSDQALYDQAFGDSNPPTQAIPITDSSNPDGYAVPPSPNYTRPSAASATSGSAQAIGNGTYSQSGWEQIVQAHGGVVSNAPTKTKAYPNPDYDSSLPEGPNNPKTLNGPDPTAPLEITFADGTAVQAKLFDDGSAQVSMPSSSMPKYQIVKGADGSVYRINPTDPNAQPTLILPGKRPSNPANYVPIQDPETGAVVAYVDPATGRQYRLPTSSMTPHTVSFGHTLYQWDPSTKSYKPLITDASGQLTEQLNQDRTRLEIAQAQRNLLPEQQKLIQDGYATIDMITSRMKQGLITPQEGQQLMDNVYKSIDAGLQGTTLFQQQQEAQKTKYENATLGKDILDSRLSAGTNLADSILRSAVGHIMMPAGKTTLGIDPLQIANQEVNTLGGGQDVQGLAKNLLFGLLGGGTPSNSGGGGAGMSSGISGLPPAAPKPSFSPDLLKVAQNPVGQPTPGQPWLSPAAAQAIAAASGGQ